MLELPQLLRPLPSCTLCPLSVGAKHPGIPTLHLQGTPAPRSGSPATLFLGQNPGYTEDASGLPFHGYSGAFLRLIIVNYLGLARYEMPTAGVRVPRSAWDLSSLLSNKPHAQTCYVSNVARCFTAADTVPAAAYSRCSKAHLLPDLHALLSFHSSLTVLCLGAPAATTLWQRVGGKKVKLADCFGNNGRSFEGALGTSSPLHYFATYHPSLVARNANMIRPMADHLRLLLRHYTSTLPTTSTPTMIPPGLPPCPTPASPPSSPPVSDNSTSKEYPSTSANSPNSPSPSSPTLGPSNDTSSTT